MRFIAGLLLATERDNLTNVLNLARRLTSHPPRDVAVAASAWVLLGASYAALRVVPFESLVRLAGLRAVDDVASDSSLLTPPSVDELRRLSWGIAAAAARTPWTSACLAQAITGATLLRARHEPSRLYLGVRPANLSEGLLMTAHAWLVSSGQVVTGNSGREQYGVVAVFEGGPMVKRV